MMKLEDNKLTFLLTKKRETHTMKVFPFISTEKAEPVKKEKNKMLKYLQEEHQPKEGSCAHDQINF